MCSSALVQSSLLIEYLHGGYVLRWMFPLRMVIAGTEYVAGPVRRPAQLSATDEKQEAKLRFTTQKPKAFRRDACSTPHDPSRWRMIVEAGGLCA